MNRYPDVNPGIGLGVEPKMDIIKELLENYNTLSFNEENKNGTYKTIVDYTSEILHRHGLENKEGIQQVAGITIYPKDYFNPLEHVNQLNITPNTRSIHHYAATWVEPKVKLKKRIIQLMGPKLYSIILKLRK